MNYCRPRQLLGSAVSKTPSKWRGSVTCRRHATNITGGVRDSRLFGREVAPLAAGARPQ